MKAYDYSALSQPVSKDDVKRMLGTGSTKTFSYFKGLFVFVGVLAFIMFSIMAINYVFSGSGFSMIPFVLLTIVVTGIGVVLIAVDTARKHYLAKLHKFAQANGFTLHHDETSPGYAGMIFDEGRARTLKEALLSSDGLEIGNYEYTTGSGKNQTTHIFGFVRLALARQLPNMVLDAKSNNFLAFSNLPDSFDRSQRLQLEGDFNSHFDLYVPKQYERDALYVFTPDVMQVLINHGKMYDMEVVDNELFIYQSSRLEMASESRLRAILSVVDAIGVELRDQTKRYSDERVPLAAGHSAMVGDKGRRLAKGINPLMTFIFVVFILFFLLQFSGTLLMISNMFLDTM